MHQYSPNYKLTAEQYVDNFIKSANNYGAANISKVFFNGENRARKNPIDNDFLEEIRSLMVGKYRYATLEHPFEDYKLTEIGLLAKEKGGHIEYQKYLDQERKRAKPKWHVEHPIWYAIICAVSAAGLSIIAHVVENKIDAQSDNQSLQEIKQTATDANRKSDSLIGILKNLQDFSNKKSHDTTIEVK